MAKMAKPGTYIKYGKMMNPDKPADADVYTEDDVRSIFNDVVWKAVGRDSAMKLSDLLWPNVFQDVRECSGYPYHMNYDDVRLAFGRVLCKRLGTDSEESLEDRIENLKGCLFSRDQITRIRQIASDSEHVLDTEVTE